MFTFAKNPLIAATTIAGALVIATFAMPAKAQEPNCTTELQTLDTVLQNTKLKPEVMFKVNALRESAIARNAQGDVDGCMQDVNDIKVLMGG